MDYSQDCMIINRVDGLVHSELELILEDALLVSLCRSTMSVNLYISPLIIDTQSHRTSNGHAVLQTTGQMEVCYQVSDPCSDHQKQGTDV